MAGKTVKLGGYRRQFGGRHSSVSIRADEVEFMLEPRELGKGVADAILEVIRERVDGIKEAPLEATLRRRRSAGRTSSKLFEDTGKLLRELRSVFRDDSYQTESPSRLTGPQSYLLERLAKLIDLSPASIMRDRRVREAVEASQRVLIRVRKTR